MTAIIDQILFNKIPESFIEYNTKLGYGARFIDDGMILLGPVWY